MSMTLILWKAPVVEDAQEAARLIKPWYESGDDSAFEPSAELAGAAEMLRSRWPDQYDGEVPDNCPWADMPFEQSERLLAIHIRWSAGDEVITAIYALAKTHQLVLYDPQGPDVFLPSDLLEPGPVPPLTVWDWLKIVAMATFLCALTYAAWQIPIGWIRWPAVIVAGFFATAACSFSAR